MTRPYQEWVELSRRWQAAVDFGSPVSAWTPEMLEEARKAREEGRRPSMANIRRSSGMG